MLLIQPDNLSVLDYEIAGSDTGQYILLCRCGVLDLSRFMGGWLLFTSREVELFVY
jgi:hypothetical protein